MGRRAVVVAAVLVALLLPGCTEIDPVLPGPDPSSASPTPRTTDRQGAFGPLGAPGCAPASPLRAPDLPEVQATPGGSTTAYGLLFTERAPLTAGAKTVKMVWRVTGRGLLDLSVLDPHGDAKRLAWGPEFHDSSSYRRPGEEWGMGVVLDEPGCWEVRLRRASGTAHVWLDVRPPTG